MTRVTLFASMLVFMAQAQSLAAEELIFDPENPSAPDEEETIFDPENPGSTDSVPNTTPEPAEPAAPSNTYLVLSWASRSQIDTKWQDDEDHVEHIAELGLRLDSEISPSLRAFVDLELEHWGAWGQDQPSRYAADVRLGEAYVAWRKDSWSVRAGNLVTRWGSTDITRPSDIINPVDLTDLGAGALTRVAQPAAEIGTGGSNWRLTGVLVPFFVGNRTWTFGRDTALWSPQNPAAESLPISKIANRLLDSSIQDDVQPALSATRVPDETPENISFGFRSTTTLANTDLALGWYYGWDRTPSLQINPEFRGILETLASDEAFLNDFNFLELVGRNTELIGQFNTLSESLQNGESALEIYHERLMTMSAEVSRYVGPIGVRADVAFQPEKTYVRQDLSTERKPTLSGALGLSWENLNAEDDFFTLTVEGFAVEPIDGEEYLGVGRRALGVASLVGWALPAPSLEIQLAGVWTASNEDLILAPSVSWKGLEHMKVRAFAVFFETWGGSAISNAKILDQNDFVGIELSGQL